MWMWRGWWARPEQLAPEGDWGVWAYIAGRGAGKTRAGAEWVREQVQSGKKRIGMIAPTSADARDVMVEGESGILKVCGPRDIDNNGVHMGMPLYEASKRRLTWANGAIATLYSAEEAARLRGPQHDAIWADELAAWKDGQDVWDMAQFGLRLGDNPRAIVTTTPKTNSLIIEILEDPGTIVTRGSTYSNAANLAKKFLEKIKRRYEGTRLGRQEIHAELLTDVQGALWTNRMIEDAKIRGLGYSPEQVASEALRIVVAIDPSGASGDDDTADEIGILVCAKLTEDRYAVLEDASGVFSPAGWAKRACERYDYWGADRIIAERNFGGAMVESTIRNARPDGSVPVTLVTASRGKAVRAEPVAALYEQKRVVHVGELGKVEEQMTHMTNLGFVGKGSPDRLDAAVWGLSELSGSSSQVRMFLKGRKK